MSDKLINNLIPSDPENIECELVSPDRKHSRLWKMKDGKVKMLAKSSMFAQPDPENPHSPKIIDNCDSV